MPDVPSKTWTTALRALHLEHLAVRFSPSPSVRLTISANLGAREGRKTETWLDTLTSAL